MVLSWISLAISMSSRTARRIGWKFGAFDEEGSLGVRSSKKGCRNVGMLDGYESRKRYARVDDSLLRRTDTRSAMPPDRSWADSTAHKVVLLRTGRRSILSSQTPTMPGRSHAELLSRRRQVCLISNGPLRTINIREGPVDSLVEENYIDHLLAVHPQICAQLLFAIPTRRRRTRSTRTLEVQSQAILHTRQLPLAAGDEQTAIAEQHVPAMSPRIAP